MPQTNVIKVKRTTVPSKVPTTSDIVAGELAANLIDKILYTRDTSNNIISLTGVVSNIAGTGISLSGTNNVTISIDSTVATLTGSQTLTNKTISGSNNTISNIGNSSLTNSSITINGTTVSLGGTATISVSAGGSDTQVQYNSSNTLAGSANLTFDGTRLTAAALTVDTNTLYVDATNDRVGIGTSSPTNVLDVVSTTQPSIMASTYISGSAAVAGYFAQAARGTVSSPTATQSGDRTVCLIGRSYGGTTWVNHGAINLYCAENQSESARGSYLTFDTTATGATSRSERMRIDSSGNVGIGTSTPSGARLQVYSLAGGTGAAINLQNLGSGDTALSINNSGGTNRFNIRLFSTETVTGLYGNNADVWIGSNTNGTIPTKAYAYFNNTTENVGIGTTSPGTKLEVFGSITARAAATQDSVIIAGRAGGTSSYGVTLTPTTLSASRTLTLPDTTGTIVTTGDTGTVTSTMIANGTIVDADINASAAIAVSKLAASTISGITLGNNLNTLTMNVSGTGLSGSTTYNGSAAATFTVTSNATSANTASAIVARDASGNFSAGTITATTLAGTLSTAAQTNITSLGTLTSLTISGNLTVDTNTLFVDSTNDRVGIGTTSPARTLHVHNAVADNHLYLSNTGPSIIMGNNVTFASSTMYYLMAMATANGQYGLNAGDTILGNYGNSRGNLHINSNYSGTGTTNVIMQPSSGSVGIGIAPTTKLHVAAATNNGLSITSTDGTTFRGILFNTNDSALSMGTTTAHGIAFYTSNAERASINSAGDVIIGNASNPGNTLRYLDLYNTNTGASAGAILRLITSNSAGTSTSSVDIVRYKTGLFVINNNDSSGIITINNAGSERMRIDSSGNVGIGTTNPLTKLQVGTAGGGVGADGNTTLSAGTLMIYGVATSGAALTWNANTNGGFANTVMAQLKPRQDTSANYNLDVFCGTWNNNNSAGTAIATFQSTGNVGIGTASPSRQLMVNGTGQNTSAITDAGNQTASIFISSTNGTNGAGGALLLGGTTSAIPTVQWAIKSIMINPTGNGTADLAFATRAGTGDTTLTERMRIDSSGNVGIGTSSPAAKLDIRGAGAGIIVAPDNNSAGGISLFGTNAQTYGSPPIYFLSAANNGGYPTAGVGLGSLDFRNSAYGQGAYIYAYATQNHSSTASGGELRFGTTLNGSTSASERMRIDSSGNVGIGTSTIGGKLTIVSGDSATASNQVIISGGRSVSNGAGAILFTNSFWNSGFGAANIVGLDSEGSGGHLSFGTLANGGGASGTPTEKMRILQNGNVAIGSSAAARKLTVYEGTAGTADVGVRVEHVSNKPAYMEFVTTQRTASFGLGNYSGVGFTGAMQLVCDGGFHICPSGTGNVGIGTSSPNAKLQVVGNIQVGNNTADWLYLYNSNYGIRASSGLEIQSGDYIRLLTSGANERMRIDSSGNVLINTSSQPSTTGGNAPKLTVVGSQRTVFLHGENALFLLPAANNGAANGDAGLYMWISEPNHTWTGAGIARNMYNTTNFPRVNSNLSGQMIRFDEGTFIQFTVETSGGARSVPLTVGNGGTEVLAGNATDNGAYNLQCNGTAVWGAGAYVNGSDFRLKTNIKSLDSGLDVVKAVRPVTFQYKPEYNKDENIQTGFIAQELLEALKDKEYVDGIVQKGHEYLSVAYQNFIPILVKAIQELTTRVEELENK